MDIYAPTSSMYLLRARVIYYIMDTLESSSNVRAYARTTSIMHTLHV